MSGAGGTGSGFRPSEDAEFEQQWKYLQDVLRSLCRPPALDRRGRPPQPGREVPRPYPQDCLLFLEIPETHWGKTLSAPRVLPPGSMLWALCSTWLEPRDGRLWCHRGIWADRGGQIYLDDFDPPREVSYFANFYTAPETYGRRTDGTALEAGLACPMSSTEAISEFVACKVTTRLLASQRGVPVPHSLAFFREIPAHLAAGGETREIRLVALGREAGGEDAALRRRVREALEQRLPAWPAHVERVVVKPSGPFHMQCWGVSVHPRHDLASVAGAVTDLFCGRGTSRFLPKDGVLVDAFGGGVERTMRVRAIVARAGARPDDAMVQFLSAGIGWSETPLCGFTTIPQSIATALRNYGLPDAGAAARLLEERLRERAVATFAAVAGSDPASPGKPGGRTDLLGLDFVAALPGDTRAGMPALDPVLIEVNNHDCATITQYAAFTTADHSAPGAASATDGVLDDYFRAIATRSQEARLKGKRVIIIGGVSVSKRAVWQSAREHGVGVVLVNDRPVTAQDGLGAELAAEIVLPELHADHSPAGDEARCARIVQALAQRGIRPDGVLTFWEDCTVLAALVAQNLGARAHPVAAQRAAKDKLATARAISAEVPWILDAVEPSPQNLLPPFAELGARPDWEAPEVRRFRFPAVLRHRFGSAAVGTRLVRSLEEAKTEAARLGALVHDAAAADALYASSGFRFCDRDTGLLLSGYVEGSEHDVDLMLFDGELIDGWVTDNAETFLPYFAETCAVFPSRLDAARQRQLVNAAFQACRRLGLTDGVINAELKLSRSGPKLIEVNGRMGGYYIPDWVRRVWGYDLPAAALQIACGIRPAGRVRRKPLAALAGVLLYPGDGAEPDRIAGDDVVRVPISNPAIGHDALAEYLDPVTSLGWSAPDADAAVAKLVHGLSVLFARNPERAASLVRNVLRMPGAVPAGPER